MREKERAGLAWRCAAFAHVRYAERPRSHSLSMLAACRAHTGLLCLAANACLPHTQYRLIARPEGAELYV